MASATWTRRSNVVTGLVLCLGRSSTMGAKRGAKQKAGQIKVNSAKPSKPSRIQASRVSKRSSEPTANSQAPAMPAEEGFSRCGWVGLYTGADSSEYIEYHDKEWGRPVHDDKTLFEFLILEGAQAGLSWATILKKREAYREAFVDYDIAKIAGFQASDEERLLSPSSRIVKHRGKVAAAISNARVALEVAKEHGSLSAYLWSFVPNEKPIQNAWTDMKDVPAKTEESEAMSRALKTRGFKFVGPTICYAFMQAVGMVNDHTTACSCHAECAALAEACSPARWSSNSEKHFRDEASGSQKSKAGKRSSMAETAEAREGKRKKKQ